MNKIMQNKSHTWIVQAEKIIKTYPDGESILKPIKAHYFKTLNEVKSFLNRYIPVLSQDKKIRCLTVGSKYSVGTVQPFIITWYND